jgi:hypothetical protein
VLIIAVEAAAAPGLATSTVVSTVGAVVKESALVGAAAAGRAAGAGIGWLGLESGSEAAEGGGGWLWLGG